MENVPLAPETTRPLHGVVSELRRPASDIPIGVTDLVPAYRQGLVMALQDAGFDAEVVPDVDSWNRRAGRRALLLSVRLPQDSAILSSLQAANENLILLALLREAEVRAYDQALRAGAGSAVAWDATPDLIIKVLSALLDGACLLPVPVARALFVNDNPIVDLTDLAQEEVRWLQLLANGATVAGLARQASYSEREMFRLLNRLYQRLGARNRMEALVRAARSGLLEAEFAEPNVP